MIRILSLSSYFKWLNNFFSPSIKELFHVKHSRIYIKVMLIMFQPFNRLFSSNNKVDNEQSNKNEDDVIRIDVNYIIPNQFQPRTEFDQEKIEELAQTLHTHG